MLRDGIGTNMFSAVQNFFHLEHLIQVAWECKQTILKAEFTAGLDFLSSIYLVWPHCPYLVQGFSIKILMNIAATFHQPYPRASFENRSGNRSGFFPMFHMAPTYYTAVPLLFSLKRNNNNNNNNPEETATQSNPKQPKNLKTCTPSSPYYIIWTICF